MSSLDSGVRGWLRRRRVLLGAALAGVGGASSTLAGSDHATAASAIMLSLMIGGVTAISLVLIEGAIRRALTERPATATSPAVATSPVRPAVVAPAEPQPAGPDSLSTFRGRTAELAELLELHGRERQARRLGAVRPGRLPEPRRSLGTVLLLIHGKPGVGKSALAQELARRLAPEYPDGAFYANFGTAGRPRPPAEILKSFLVDLGWPEAEMPGDTAERASLLRSITAGKQILFIFDAARHHDQVLQVMPTEPGCAVIVTSRRDMGPALNAERRPPLEVPSVDEALELLSAVSRTDWVTRAEPAIEIVQLCGRLPLAIRSAGERVALDGTDLRHVADLLRPEKTRLGWLDWGGRSVRERIDSEYKRLVQRQQRALCLLTLVESTTFVPWVLGPLLNVKQHEAENIMASLAAAQLLDTAGQDRATGFARYAFNPLVRLFAQEMLAVSDTRPEAARARLDDAYAELCDDVLAELKNGYTRTRTGRRKWLPSETQVHRTIAHLPDHGIRAEYHNLVRVVRVTSERGDQPMCWRVAAWLQGCVPAGASVPASLAAFDRAVEAAHDDPIGGLDVRIAKAAFLIAVEWYPAAFDILADAHKRAVHIGQTGHEARVHRKMAEAYLQMGAYQHATAELDRAAELAGGPEEQRVIRLLRAENHRVPSPDPSYADILEGRLDDPVYFRAHLGLSEAARRRGYWHTAEEHLYTAEQHSTGDMRRIAAVHYRLARLYIDQWRHEMPGNGVPHAGRTPVPDAELGALADLAERAVGRAAEAALAFRAMGNEVGLVRARSQEIRALVIAGRLAEAEQLSHTTWHSLLRPDLKQSPAWNALLARFARAFGELLLHRGDVGAAWRALVKAATLYAGLEDWACHAEIWRLLETVQRIHQYPAGSTFRSVDHVLEDAIAAVAPVASWTTAMVPRQRDATIG